MSKTTSTGATNKTVLWVIIAVVAVFICAFSAYRSLIAPQRGKSVGTLNAFPGGKQGLIERQKGGGIE